jgi:hypothetical protein
VCLAWGAIVISDGSDRQQQARATLSREEAARKAAAEKCPTKPTPDQQRLCQLTTSFDSEAYKAADRMLVSASQEANRGYDIVILAALLWPAYMLLRWVFTGSARVPNAQG